MIRLSDYLDYLHNEIIQARKKADEHALEVARYYAEHEYLKYFKVPRFTMPSIKIDIPLKIADIDSETKYDFVLNRQQFVSEVNKKVHAINAERQLGIPTLKLDDVTEKDFRNLFARVEYRDHRFTRDLLADVIRTNIDVPVSSFLQNKIFTPLNIDNDVIKYEFKKLVTEVIVDKHVPVASKLNEMYIDPDTSKETDKNKQLLNLHVEMLEESIRIIRITDRDGEVVEEISFE